MHLAVMHHHLNRGGVTSVIANHVRSLATLAEAERPERVVVFFDGQRDGWPNDLPSALPVELVVAPELAYDAPGAAAKPQALADALAGRLSDCGLAADDTLLHVHNHSLGKSASLPGALSLLAAGGWRMLLQVHDFAEDNRPENYRHLRESLGEGDADRLGAILYPQGQGIHYATLTERDAEVLGEAGVDPSRLHVLPNPVAEFGEMPSQEEARTRVFPLLGLAPDARLIVYPVRGIRRKNLGEMLLLSALAPEGTYFAVTLRPKNPVEAASFDRWRRLAEDLDLPCRFDTGGPLEAGGYGCDFKDTLAAADAILTTSVAEGFGMVFLEAWLAGKPLVGRDLPEITREFKALGIVFDGLVEAVHVSPPDEKIVRRVWEAVRCLDGGPTSSEPPALADFESDFGREIPCVQELTVENASVYGDGESADYLRKANQKLLTSIAGPPLRSVSRNAAVVREHYSADRIGRRLRDVLRSVAESSGEATPIRGQSIVDHFAEPERQHSVRFEVVDSSQESILSSTIAKLSQPLEAQPTGEDPVLPSLAGIRAVVFDVYGTLLVSGSGDISLASEGSRGAAAMEALQAVRGWPTCGDEIVNALHAAIRAAHNASPSNHPEVEIREIWRAVLDGLGVSLDEAAVERLAVEYECRVNPIWPMPGLAETLQGLRGAGLALGIVSNAQFFTPLAFEPLTGRRLEGWGFDPEIGVWSFERGEAKPGTFLYQRCVEGLAARGIRPEEALFVGNDLRNDVWPAQRVGLKTALFAGDARSLRWRRDDERVRDVRPDAVVTDLRQLLELVSAG